MAHFLVTEKSSHAQTDLFAIAELYTALLTILHPNNGPSLTTTSPYLLLIAIVWYSITRSNLFTYGEVTLSNENCHSEQKSFCRWVRVTWTRAELRFTAGHPGCLGPISCPIYTPATNSTARLVNWSLIITSYKFWQFLSLVPALAEG